MSRPTPPKPFVEDWIAMYRIQTQWHLKTLPAKAYELEWSKEKIEQKRRELRAELTNNHRLSMALLEHLSDKELRSWIEDWRHFPGGSKAFMRNFERQAPTRYDQTLRLLEELTPAQRKVLETADDE
jgi:hypothetical protein